MSKLPDSLHGVWASAGTIADLIHAGRLAKSHLEGRIREWWPDLDHLDTDRYGNCLKVYFKPNPPTNNDTTLEATPEQQQVIWDAGFDFLWLNFKGGRSVEGGSSRAYVNPEWMKSLEERIAAQKPGPLLHLIIPGLTT